MSRVVISLMSVKKKKNDTGIREAFKRIGSRYPLRMQRGKLKRKKNNENK